MRKLSLLTGGLVIVLLVSAGLVAAQTTNFVADLSGSQEVPSIETVATGQATFEINPSSTALTFVITVTNIENVTAAHIHCARAGANGPIGVALSAGAFGPINGILAQGTITTPNPGNGCGWANFAAIVAALRSGNTYINVHTVANPSGEIRGQIQ